MMQELFPFVRFSSTPYVLVKKKLLYDHLALLFVLLVQVEKKVYNGSRTRSSL